MGPSSIIESVGKQVRPADGDDYENLDEEVVRYGSSVIVMHWFVIALFAPLAVTGLMLLRDWFMKEFNIYGGDLLVPTFNGAVAIHVMSGLGLLVTGLAHILIHLRQRDKPILPKDVQSEFKATLQTIFYVMYISRYDEVGSSHKYKANQRMSYLSTIYTIALSAFTALFIFELGAVGSALHVVAGTLVGLLSAYRFAYLIRRWDWTAIKCVMWTGTMPMWYIKENHYLWYQELKAPPAPPAPVAPPAADEGTPA